jgi:hypothetical protein
MRRISVGKDDLHFSYSKKDARSLPGHTCCGKVLIGDSICVLTDRETKESTPEGGPSS